MFSGLVGAALGGIASLGSSALSNWLGKENAEDAANESANLSKELAAWKAVNLPKLEKQGLEAAGINPLMAYGSIGNSAMPTLSVDSYAPRFDGIAEALSRLPESASARALKVEQVETLRADRSKVEAEEDLLRAQAQEIRSRIPKNEEQAGEIADNRKGVINFYGTRISLPELWRKIQWFGDLLGSSARQMNSRVFDLTGSEDAHTIPQVRPSSFGKVGTVIKKVFGKSDSKKPSKVGSDASWIPGGGSSARDMMRKRLKQF